MTGVALAAGDTISAPSISYTGLAPILIMLGAGLVGVLIEAGAPKALRLPAQVTLGVGACVASLVAVVLLSGRAAEVTVAGVVAVDGPALFCEGTLAVLGIFSVLLLAERRLDAAGGALVAQAALTVGSVADQEQRTSRDVQTEAFPLMTFALGGMMLFPASNNLLVMFIALEVLSLPLYLLAGLARHRRLLSQEAAVKYFLLGAFASAFFVYGLAMLYGYAGTVSLPGIRGAISGSDKGDLLLLVGFALLVVGMLFKGSVAPFHSWTPDVYQGSPTPITAFMSAATKVAAFGAMLRVFYVAFGDSQWDWRPVMWAVGIVSMLVGAVLGLTQTDVKRILAYSSIAHAGFLIVGVISLNQRGISGTLFYLLTYGIASLGAFAVVSLVRDNQGEATHLSQWAGLARRSPLVAAAMTVFLLSMAGIPLTAGFIGKFVIFQAGVDGGLGTLVVIALVSSAIAAFFYLRIVVLMYFSDPPEGGPAVSVPSVFTQAVVTLTVLGTVFLGVIPQPILDVAHKAAAFVS